jgi:hypothetical protein
LHLTKKKHTFNQTTIGQRILYSMLQKPSNGDHRERHKPISGMTALTGKSLQIVLALNQEEAHLQSDNNWATIARPPMKPGSNLRRKDRHYSY